MASHQLVGENKRRGEFTGGETETGTEKVQEILLRKKGDK
jgi:hypothetical protein